MGSLRQMQQFTGYKAVSIIGKGGFGIAGLYIRNADKKKVVIKEVETKTRKDIENVENEVKHLAMMRHSHIIKYYDSMQVKNTFYIEMEYAAGGSLDKYLAKLKSENDRLEEQDVLYLFKQITDAVYYLHKNEILHRDLKPANIFLTEDNQCKIGDFGLSKHLPSAETHCGTIVYMSPEMLKNKRYDEKVDVWALGCILHEMCKLKRAFKNVVQITKCQYKPISSRRYSEDLQELIDRILQKDPGCRPSARKIRYNYIPELQKKIKGNELHVFGINFRTY